MSYFFRKGTPDRRPRDDRGYLLFPVFGKVIVVLNSIKASKDRFERRSDIYSDRPVIPIFEVYALLS